MSPAPGFRSWLDSATKGDKDGLDPEECERLGYLHLMCELFAMSSRVPATVNLSLEEFSQHGGLTGPHRDGWGVAYYDDGDALLVKEPLPASESNFVRFIEQHDLRSTLVISHIRRASQGRIALKNTQPYARELGGRMHLFAHNGDLGEIHKYPEIRLGAYRPVGDTDSEYAFCTLLHRLQDLWLSARGVPSLAERLRLISKFASLLRELGSANFLYSDSHTLLAHGHKRKQGGEQSPRPPGLHSLCRTCEAEPAAMVAKGLRIAVEGAAQEIVLVASVPLTSEAWAPVAEGEILAISHGRIAARSPR